MEGQASPEDLVKIIQNRIDWAAQLAVWDVVEPHIIRGEE